MIESSGGYGFVLKPELSARLPFTEFTCKHRATQCGGQNKSSPSRSIRADASTVRVIPESENRTMFGWPVILGGLADTIG